MPQPRRERKPRRPGWYLEPRRDCCPQCSSMAGNISYREPKLPHPNCRCRIKRLDFEAERTEVVSATAASEDQVVNRMSWPALCNCSTPYHTAGETPRGKNVHLFEFPAEYHDKFTGEFDVWDKIKASGWQPHREMNEYGLERDYVHHELPPEKCIQFNYKVTMRRVIFLAQVKYTVFKKGTDEVVHTFEEPEGAAYTHWVSMDLDEDSGYVSDCPKKRVGWNE